MRNKRNYYRILHVQFDAPPAVIKASYRAIMQKLQAHPDLGGEEWNASLINEAKNILLDPLLRAEYDSQLSASGNNFDIGAGQTYTPNDLGGRPVHYPSDSNQTTSPRWRAAYELATDTPSALLNISCAFCQTQVSKKPPELIAYPTVHRCTRCDAPLKSPDKHRLEQQDDLRKVNRTDLEQQVSVWDKWPRDSGFSATVYDWSIAGCCVQMSQQLKTDTNILILSPVFDAVAIVRYGSEHSFYGLEFLTLELKMKPGSILASSA